MRELDLLMSKLGTNVKKRKRLNIYWCMIKGCEIIIILENGIIFSPMQYSSDTPLGDDIHLNRN